MDQSAPGRYRVIGHLGRGGTAEVEQVLDVRLGRVLARKRLRDRAEDAPERAARFAEEARLQAHLQHPGVIPVHDLDLDEQDRPAFTLAEVRGLTLSAWIRAVHAASSPAGWGQTAEGVGLRRLIEQLARAGEAIAYAHTQGVVHRDLKPTNIMVGPFGELFVLDWGIAQPIGATPTRLEGTPSYLAPEVAAGDRSPISTTLDVFGLGGVLYEILSGRAPFQGADLNEVLAQARACAPPPPHDHGGPTPPVELVDLCLRCLARRPEDRPSSAAAVVSALHAWLDGVARRDAARRAIDESRGRLQSAERIRQEAARERHAAVVALQGVSPWEPEERKLSGWAHEDRAAELDRQATSAMLEAEEILEAAIALDPEGIEARAALADLHADALTAAEAQFDRPAEAAARDALIRHTVGLPALPQTSRWRALIERDAWLSLETDPPHAEVLLERYEVLGRRLVPVPLGVLGYTPLVNVQLAAGSYLLRLRAPGHQEVLYPLRVGLRERWTAGPEPGAPWVVPLPRTGFLTPDELYVPAGPYLTRSDRASQPQRAWVDGFIARRDPLTIRELAEALNAMVDAGHPDRARALAEDWPAELQVYGNAKLGVARTAEGRYVATAPDPELPAAWLDHRSATLVGRWLTPRRATPWHLPTVQQWIKGTYGADGRLYPFGNTMLPVWTWRRESAPSVQGPLPVRALTHDVSPFGLRGCAGNVRTWCEAGPEGPPDCAPVVGHDWHQATFSGKVYRQVVERSAARFDILGARYVRKISF